MIRPVHDPPVIEDHLRFVVVLALLKELSQPTGSERPATRHVAKLVKSLGLSSLFESGDAGGTASRARRPRVLKHDEWASHFAVKRRRGGGSSPFNNVYECQPFYGVAATNNLQQRLARLLGDGVAGPGGADQPKTRKATSYDQNIAAWGRYARDLVILNGGWAAFSGLTSLAQVNDLWPGTSGATHGGKGPTRSAASPTSLVSRILLLEQGRYVQVLTAAVGMLWPVWALALDEGRELLPARSRVLSADQAGLYVDVVTHVGQMEGLPFPFGFADSVVLANHSYLRLAPWPPEAVQTVWDALATLYWSPPILFGARSEQWLNRPPQGVNAPIPLVSVSESCPIFATLYVRKESRRKDGSLPPLGDLTLVYERDTWAENIATYFPKRKALNRSETLTNFPPQDADVVATYFAADLTLRASTTYDRLTPKELFASFPDRAEELQHVFPSTVLAGGQLLSRQPKGPRLIVDLAVHLRRIDAGVRGLLPSSGSLDRSLRALETEAGRPRAVEDLALACREVAVTRGEKPERVQAVQRCFEAIGRAMVAVLATPEDDSAKKAALKEFTDWGWAALVQYARYTSVFISCDLFIHKELP